MKHINLDRLPKGELIRRADLHTAYGGSRKADVAPSRKAGGLFLFSADAGAPYDLRDGWTAPNEYELCVVVDDPGQSWDTASRSVRDHQKAGRRMYLFRTTSPEMCRYLGRVELRGYRTQDVTDRARRTRTAVIFTLRESRLVLDMSASDHSLVDSAMKQVAERLRQEGSDFVGPVPLPSDRDASENGDGAPGRMHRRSIYVRFPEASTIAALTELPLPSGIEIELRQE